MNGFTKHWELFVKGFVLRRNSPLGRGFGTITSMRRLVRSLELASKGMAKRTWSLSARHEREKQRVPTKMVTVMRKPHSWGRRRA